MYSLSGEYRGCSATIGFRIFLGFRLLRGFEEDEIRLGLSSVQALSSEQDQRLFAGYVTLTVAPLRHDPQNLKNRGGCGASACL